MAALEIRLLGPFGVLDDGRAVTVPGFRLRVLLAVLAMAPARPVPIGTIGTAVWGPKPPANLQASVYTYVARLRHLFGDRAISTGDGEYRLVIEPDAVDALRFLRLADEGDVSALDLWRGQPFADLRSDWLDQKYGTSLTERYLQLLERRIDQDLANGKAADLVAELSTLVDQHPLSESLWARLLTALDRSGRPAEALERYETIRQRLATELAIDPGMELRQLHARLLAADAATVRPFEIPRQLPSDIARFTGRKRPLAKLDRPSSLAVVHGTAGVGKTALVVHWAHRVRDRFPDGQLFVNLRGFGPSAAVEPAAALDGLLRALGVAGEQVPSGLDVRSAMLRKLLAGRRVLMVLDNARDAAQVRPLLPDPPSQVVITSRNRLDGLAEHGITLEELTPDESLTLLTTALGSRPMLAELAELCGHLPLALAVAAEHAGRYSDAELVELVEDLRDRRTKLDALDIGDAATNPRVVFSWSYQALEPATAGCFRLLSLHPGPDFGARSAAALIGTPTSRATQLLDGLTNAHLIRQTAPDRYEMHDLLRAYAAELCGEQESDPALNRVYDWYLHSAANAKGAMGSPIRPVGLGDPDPGAHPLTFEHAAAALAWFDRERNNLLALVRDAADRRRHLIAHRAAHATLNYLTNRYLMDDAFDILHITSEAAGRAGDKHVLATCANHLGMLYSRTSVYPAALTHIERALELFGEIGDGLGTATALRNLGTVLFESGRPEEAVKRFRQTIELAQEIGNVHVEASGLNNMAVSCIRLARYDEAVDACERAIEIYRRQGNETGMGYALDTLGQALAAQGRHRDAIVRFDQSLTILAETGNAWNTCTTLVNMGRAQHASGLTDEAHASWLRALRIFDELDATDTAELRRADLVTLLAKAN